MEGYDRPKNYRLKNPHGWPSIGIPCLHQFESNLQVSEATPCLLNKRILFSNKFKPTLKYHKSYRILLSTFLKKISEVASKSSAALISKPTQMLCPFRGTRKAPTHGPIYLIWKCNQWKFITFNEKWAKNPISYHAVTRKSWRSLSSANWYPCPALNDMQALRLEMDLPQSVMSALEKIHFSDYFFNALFLCALLIVGRIYFALRNYFRRVISWWCGFGLKPVGRKTNPTIPWLVPIVLWIGTTMSGRQPAFNLLPDSPWMRK